MHDAMDVLVVTVSKTWWDNAERQVRTRVVAEVYPRLFPLDSELTAALAALDSVRVLLDDPALELY